LLRLHKHRFAGVLGISKNSDIAFRDAQLFFNTMNQRTRRYFHQYWQLYAMLLLPLLYFIIFKYVPIFGNVLAFRRYRPGLGAFGTEWVGLRYFTMFFKDPAFWRAFRNTLTLSLMNLLINFPIPIIFALLLNEIRSVFF